MYEPSKKQEINELLVKALENFDANHPQGMTSEAVVNQVATYKPLRHLKTRKPSMIQDAMMRAAGI